MMYWFMTGVIVMLCGLSIGMIIYMCTNNEQPPTNDDDIENNSFNSKT